MTEENNWESYFYKKFVGTHMVGDRWCIHGRFVNRPYELYCEILPLRQARPPRSEAVALIH